MWIVCQTDDSHEMSRLVFSEKKKRKMSSAAAVIDALRVKSNHLEKDSKCLLVRVISHGAVSVFNRLRAFYTPPLSCGGILWFHVGCSCVCPSVSLSVHPLVVLPSVFRFQMITWVNFNGFSPNLVWALILWRSGLGLLMGKFRQILMVLSAGDTIMVGYYSLTFLFVDYRIRAEEEKSRCPWLLTSNQSEINS